ncbi:MAG: DUF4377 domain-containing protein [Rikenellaceae bacterium]|nr:DUF4377 domain-containing protein [Rikenellaceae bacterium]
MKNFILTVIFIFSLSALGCTQEDSDKIFTVTVASSVQERENENESTSVPFVYYVKFEDSMDWEMFPHYIGGFEYEEGYEYRIKMKQTRLKNPAQDQDPLEYTLLEILTKTQKDSEGLPLHS